MIENPFDDFWLLDARDDPQSPAAVARTPQSRSRTRASDASPKSAPDDSRQPSALFHLRFHPRRDPTAL
jgi:hypothetical protein